MRRAARRRALKRAESRLIEAGALALALALRRRLPDVDLFVEPIAGGVAAATIAGSPFNKVAGLGFAGPLDASELDRVEQGYAARGIPVQFEVASLGIQLVCPTACAPANGR